jgi:hypothetical protein
MASPFMVLSAVPKWNQQGILEGNAAEHTSLGTGYSPRVARKGSNLTSDKDCYVAANNHPAALTLRPYSMDPTGIPMIAIMGRGGTGV